MTGPSGWRQRLTASDLLLFLIVNLAVMRLSGLVFAALLGAARLGLIAAERVFGVLLATKKLGPDYLHHKERLKRLREAPDDDAR